MASSSSAPAPKPRPYEVFLSFRGEDIRLNFVSHLRGALDRRGIIKFYDNESLRYGENLPIELMNAIKKSSIAIVVFSKDYASSTWCLKELVKIVECKNEGKLEIYPIFYHVEPTDVRKQTKTFLKPFEDHEVNFKDNIEMVDAWRKALREVSNLKGVDIRGKCEYSLIEEIAAEILCKLPSEASLYTKSLVGMESRIPDLKILINKNPDKVLFIGFCGMGGVGKTTTARAVFEECKSEFDGSCFLQDVRQNKKKDELVKLQRQLLYKVLKCKTEGIDDVVEGSNMISKRMCCKRVLVVLDDVDDKEQLDVLAGDRSWFGEGSIIIITTRDEHLLKDVDDKHLIDTLNEKDALLLFCRHAFKNEYPEENYKELSHKVLRYAGGLPLALKILGDHLCKQEESFWLAALTRLKEIPETKIISVLQISFDEGLKRNEQDIFLYIACSFRGQRRCVVMECLRALRLHPEEGIEVLIQKSLIHKSCIDQSDGPFESFEMHDLLQDMGQDIVRQRANGELRRYSHVWRYEDVQTIFVDYMESAEAEAIIMPLEWPCQILKEESFVKMNKLRFLIMFSLPDIFKSSVRLPNGLLYLLWLGYPAKSILTSIPMKLVHLEMPGSLIESTPDFSHMPYLEVLDLHGSTKLIYIDPSLGRHTNIRRINLEECASLKEFPTITEMDSLEYLNLGVITKVRSFPEIWNVDSLKELSFYTKYTTGLPISIKYATGLQKLELGLCLFTTVPELPSSLQFLKIYLCPFFTEYPKRFPSQLKTLQINLSNIRKTPDFNQLPNLLELDLSRTELSAVHPSLGVHTKIAHINLSHCPNLFYFPTIVDMRCLETLDLSSTQLLWFPEITGRVDKLSKLDLKETWIRTLPQSIGHATGLKELDLSSCGDLVSLPISLQSLEKLKSIQVATKLDSPWKKEESNSLQNSEQNNADLNPSYRDPYTGSSAYVPGQLAESSGSASKQIYKHLPKRGMLVFDTAPLDSILKKILEFNKALISDSERQNLSINEVEISRVSAIIKVLKDTSHYHTSEFSDVDITLVLKLLTTWSKEELFPVIDLLRMMILHPHGATILLKHVQGGNDILLGLIKRVTENPFHANILTCIRAVTNLFKSSSYHGWLQKHRGEILEAFWKCSSSSKKSIQLSYSTLILNYAVLLIEKKDEEEGQYQILQAAVEMAKAESIDSDSKVRALLTIGSLMLDGIVREVALAYGVESIAQASKTSDDTKIAEIGADIELIIRQG